MSFDENLLRKVAHLARLSLSGEEINRYKNELARIISFVEQLNEVDVRGVEPMSHAGDRSLPFRKDEVRPTLGTACIETSSGFVDGLLKVPKIIE